jgi:PKD repeat protein
VTDSNKNMELEELFRSKLESAELIPGDNIRGDLMRKLGRKEFLRFNTSTINIYYVGVIIAAGLAAGLLLTSSPSADKIRQNIPPSEKVIIVDSASGKTGTVQLPSENNPVINVVHENVTASNQNRSQSHKNTALNTQKIKSDPAVHPVSGRNDSLLKNSQIKEQVQAADLNGIALQKKISASFEASAASGCMPMKVKFTNMSAAYDSSYWTFGDRVEGCQERWLRIYSLPDNHCLSQACGQV